MLGFGIATLPIWMSVLTWVGVRHGFMLRSTATMPVMWGAAIDVP